jgi:hypothetical protein
VTVGGQEIDRDLSDIQRIDSQALNRIDHQQRPSSMDRFAHSAQVDAIAAKVANPTDRHPARRGVDGLKDRFDGDLAILWGFHQSHFHTPSLQMFPGEAVAGKLVAGKDHRFAGPPAPAFGQQADASRCIGNEKNLVDRNIQQLSPLLSQSPRPSRPLGPANIPLLQRLSGPLADRFVSRHRQWTDRCMVHVDPLPADWQLGTQPLAKDWQGRVERLGHDGRISFWRVFANGIGEQPERAWDLEGMLATIVGIERAGFRGLTIKTRKFYLPSHR